MRDVDGVGPRRRDAERQRRVREKGEKEGLGKNLQGARYSNTALTIYTPVARSSSALEDLSGAFETRARVENPPKYFESAM